MALLAAPVPFEFSDFIKIAALGLALVIIQAVLAAWLGWSGFGPEWMLVLAVYVALRTELWAAAMGAFIFGFLRDAVGGGPWGLYSFSLVLVTWLFHPYRSRLNFFSPLTLTPLVFILGLGSCLFIMTPVMAFLDWPGESFNPLPAFMVSSALTAVTAPPLFALLERLTRKKDKTDA